MTVCALRLAEEDAAEAGELLADAALLEEPDVRSRAASHWRHPAATLLLVLALAGVALLHAWRTKKTSVSFVPSVAKGIGLSEEDASSHEHFCGLAINREGGNGFDASALRTAAEKVGAAGRLWHYNWKPTTDVQAPGIEFVPMIKEPGLAEALPPAGQEGVGFTVLGWNEPDDQGQAGRNHDLLSNPLGFAEAWTKDMQIAKNKGFTDFVSPGMAHDTCWLDYFLQGCATTAGCKELVTYLGMHRYRNDCGRYRATMDYQGWREDLGYIWTFKRLQEKYNQQGFRIKGLWWTEFGCLSEDFQGYAAASDAGRYLKAWYQDTLVKVLNDDAEVIARITDSPDSRWIGPNGPAASVGGSYQTGKCGWMAPEEGSSAGAAAVGAIKSISRMSWTSVDPGTNFLFADGGLNDLGKLYLGACRSVPSNSGSGGNLAGEGRQGATSSPGCHSVTHNENKDCYEHMHWAKYHGTHENPDVYEGLTSASPMRDFQEWLHKHGHGSCAMPC